MLNGTSVLVVEEQFLIALDIQRMLESLSAGQILFARSAHEANALEEHWASVGLAIVELALNREAACELVKRLLARDIAVVLCTADVSLRLGSPDFPLLPMLIKPMAEIDLISAIGQLLPVRS